MVQCVGCNQEFSASGYTMHVARTTTSICRAVYNKRFQVALTDNQVDDIDIDMDTAGSQRFEGDFFGNYQAVDFDWRQDEEKDDDVEMEGEDTEMEEEDNDNDPSVDFEQTTLSVDMPSEQVSDTRGAPQSETQTSQPLVHSEAQPGTPFPKEDYIVEAFPGDTAGMPLEFTTAHQSRFEDYRRRLNSDADAVYAPFTSRTDWEIARWAKIRGPSSSAFDELLQIDGVRFLFWPPL